VQQETPVILLAPQVLNSTAQDDNVAPIVITSSIIAIESESILFVEINAFSIFCLRSLADKSVCVSVYFTLFNRSN